MNHSALPDPLFRAAVRAIDAGDAGELERLLAAHPELVRDRLDSPGDWLRTLVGDALDGYFRQPYLLWFVAANPVRNGTLPKNIAQIARTLIEAAKRAGVVSLQDQLDYTLGLVATGRVARECGVQLELIDELIAGGATPGAGHGALGVELDDYCTGIHTHATPLHHAVWCGSLDAVKLLVEAGAALAIKGRIHHGTPLDWAEHSGNSDIAAYLRESEKRGSHSS